MPRAKANPDPAVLTHERPDLPGVVFTITAGRNGSYTVARGEKILFGRASQLGAYFGASLYPSNRLQAQAIAEAKARIDAARLDQLE
jgi:hypothetical protein